MKYNCIVIGGGISGLSCAIKCIAEGLECAVISTGVSALHFSSGSLDLLGYGENRKIIYKPFDSLPEFIYRHPEHPYAKCGMETIAEAMRFFKKEIHAEGLELNSNGDENHFHVTSFGTLKPTFYSQQSVFSEEIMRSFRNGPKIAVINLEGYRDFHPELAIANLKTHIFFKDLDIRYKTIRFPDYGKDLRNPFEFRSIDIARIFDTEKLLRKLAVQLKSAAGDADIIAVPSFIGIHRFNEHYDLLQELTDYRIYEIPSLPPSILGMRIDNALKSRFASLGGVFIPGDRVMEGKISGNRLQYISTENHATSQLEADYFVLSTGSFFSGGMISEYNTIREPLFNLELTVKQDRAEWHNKNFFGQESHPFLEFGVRTDRALNPCDAEGKPISNLFCTGAILSDYNPIREGSGSGVAIATGYFAANQIIEGCRKHD